jgi:hypothetical protein
MKLDNAAPHSRGNRSLTPASCYSTLHPSPAASLHPESTDSTLIDTAGSHPPPRTAAQGHYHASFSFLARGPPGVEKFQLPVSNSRNCNGVHTFSSVFLVYFFGSLFALVLLPLLGESPPLVWLNDGLVPFLSVIVLGLTAAASDSTFSGFDNRFLYLFASV